MYPDAMRITVTLSDAAVARIDEQAKLEGRSRANMIRFMLGDIEVTMGETMYGKQAIKPSSPAQLEPKPGPLQVWHEPSKPSAQANDRTFERTFVAPIPKPKDSKR